MKKDAQTYAEDTGLLFMETSAKTAMNVNELFLAIGESAFIHIGIKTQLLFWKRMKLKSLGVKGE